MRWVSCIQMIEIKAKFLKDTCVGFLMGGIGEVNENREANFMVVEKSNYSREISLRLCE